jgi:hypothetical protein
MVGLNIRIGVAAALATVDHIKVLEREAQSPSHSLDAVTKITSGKGSKLVEQGLNYGQ